ncbi:hypothetical protein FTUN_1426 [Frigoriglobus tundricola]|uniref:Uncharacterized protein n=1 Tax=Frigoriglobus tundricola TaxID=2774151 RepID=A0A6M5YLQ0_9BACT|nr:hypothetical protein FTUN_1426 [Frigoriglobus tundricola]
MRGGRNPLVPLTEPGIAYAVRSRARAAPRRARRAKGPQMTQATRMKTRRNLFFGSALPASSAAHSASAKSHR